MLNDFAARMLSERYCVEQEGPEDVFRRVAKYYGSNAAHSARLLDYMNRLWFIPATPILSNGGTSRGLAISCFLNAVPDDLAGIADHWVESMFMSVKGGGVGCVDADTEFLTNRGWVRIAEYQGQDICVVEPDTHNAYFEQPLQYIKMPCSELFRFTSRYHEIVVSRDHRNYGKTNGSEGFKVIPTSKLLSNVRNFRIPSNITIRNRPGLPFTDLELRFLVALAADGTERRSGDIKFSFVRHRKIERLRFLLNTLDIDYSESQESHDDLHDRTVFVLRQSGLKKLPLTFEHFGEASIDQLRIIVDELGHWDGSFDLRTHHVHFATSRQDEADFVQFAMTNAFDTRSGLSIKARHRQEHHATEYVVRQTGDQLTMFSGVESMVPLDGNQYCFTTSTGLWLARHKGLVFITGNSSWRDVRSVGQKTKTGGTSTGVGAFMHVSDSLMLAANQGGTRRGSMVVWQDISHPEVKSHILMRSPTGGDLNRKNLNLHTGVNITDAFMVAVLNDADWDLVDPHSKEVVETVRARELWQLLMEAPLNGSQGEPFIHWIDRSNEKLHPDLKQKGLVVNGLNLCVAPETKILTDSGWHEIHTLADQDVMVWNGTRFAIARVAQTAKQVKLLRVVLSDGTELDCTPEHRFHLGTGVKEASDLVPGDIIQKFSLPVISSCAGWSIDERLAWLRGVTVGGVICGDKRLLDEARLVLQTLGMHSRIAADGLHITDTAQDDVLVVSVTDLGRISDTYCFNEPTEHKGILNGVITGNCCEIALPTAPDRSAVCCLSSVNLERWDSWSNVPGFIEDIVEFLDNVLSDFIIKAPKELWRAVVSAKGDRSIGLGAMGFHSYLQKHNIPLDSPVARGLNKQMFSYIKEAAQHANSRLAYERGPADDLKQDRFAHLLAVAPNASTALIADVSPSIEPWNRNYYIQDTLSGAMVHKNRELDKTISKLAVSMDHYDEMWNDVRQNGGSVQHVIWLDNDQKDVFRTAFEVDQRVLIQLAADRQQHICQSQSLNLFFAAGTSVSYINECHLLAWKLGLKSRYYMRTTRERVATSFSNFEAQGNACVGGACDG